MNKDLLQQDLHQENHKRQYTYCCRPRRVNNLEGLKLHSACFFRREIVDIHSKEGPLCHTGR